MGNIKRLQDGLEKIWTDELYSEEFKSSPSKYKHFDHALKHVFKAATRLLEMTEEADHGEQSFGVASIEKYLADLVICAIRLANVNPNGKTDLETVVFDRIRRKMSTELNTEPDLIDLLKKIRDARVNSGSSGQALSMIECWARNAVAAAEGK